MGKKSSRKKEANSQTAAKRSKRDKSGAAKGCKTDKKSREKTASSLSAKKRARDCTPRHAAPATPPPTHTILENLSGYEQEDRYWASEFRQGGRKVYQTDLSLAAVAATLDGPKGEPFSEGRPAMDAARVREFGEGLIDKDDWLSPPLVLAVPDNVLTFRERPTDVAGVRFGVLGIPRAAHGQLEVLCGRHRVGGIHYALAKLHDAIRRERAVAPDTRAKADSDMSAAGCEDALARLNAVRRRFDEERMTVQLVVMSDGQTAERLIGDLAQGAQEVGPSGSGTADDRNIVDRCVADVARHPLLEGRLDVVGTRLGDDSAMLLTGKQLADVIRAVQVGVAGRITDKRAAELSDKQVAQEAWAFLDTLLAARPELLGLVTGEITPESLRTSSLLGSPTMYRVLAGVYCCLSDKDMEPRPFTAVEIQGYFASLDFSAPVNDGSCWIETGVFKEPYMSPTSRLWYLKTLASSMTAWAMDWRAQG